MDATAFSIQVFTETWMQSGVFLKKTPPCTISKWQHVNRKCCSVRPEDLELRMETSAMDEKDGGVKGRRRDTSAA
jgi:hypothetical protein